MSIFNNKRLTTFDIDVEGIRQGLYADKYYANIAHMLETLNIQGYTFQGKSPRLPVMIGNISTGDMAVNMQWFTRRQSHTLVAGTDYALAILRHATGYHDEGGNFINTSDQLQIEAVQDGNFVMYQGDPMNVQPVLRTRGVYRHFACLETPILGALSRMSRIATNAYDMLVASRGKPLLFLPARCDLHHNQAADGYAYHLAVERYNLDYGTNLQSFVTTDAQASWWRGKGSGTISHAAIACFLADAVETMLCFAATMPPQAARIALVDFNNDTVGTTLAITHAMFKRYQELIDSGHAADAEKYRLYGVRLDTDDTLRDLAVEPVGDPALDLGVNPRLVMATRRALDRAWESWDLPPHWVNEAQLYCRDVKIIATGSFTPDKITRFEQLGIPVDIYGVSSSFLHNDPVTKTEFHSDVVEVKVDGKWVNMAKIGRRPCDNPDLQPVSTNLSDHES